MSPTIIIMNVIAQIALLAVPSPSATISPFERLIPCLM